ncbi:MAG TPA: amidophosphoribosyltransferase [Thermotogota bacterium]|nr:amidophosphoribosyltransferase [Thermotogota bacterium]NLZ13300.1 amidophosphoribosyltransferase [Thermotogaceae bacterium]HNR64343.1 amidophosphoribosyltransferase [Thermotogota bacterium]HNT96278.1 amidophosphoribosyltransferase [Thermotogota bacterium]HOZ12801.1 amidophosphoribosyltransferase [Thermotogota bacterium]
MNPDKLREACGVFGVFSNTPKELCTYTYYGLLSLQHRGQESAGIFCSDGEQICGHKAMGLVTEVFSERNLDKRNFIASIGHVRYSTTGDSTLVNAQPILANYKLGSLALAHNGNLVNARVLKELLEDAGSVFQSDSDSEVILNLIARKAKLSIEEAIIQALQMIKGSYALIMLTQDKLIGVRDPRGIRPLCIGQLDDSYVLSSESCALDTIGAKLIRDVLPGELVIIDKNGLSSIMFSEKIRCATCSFEFIYFARPDSFIDGIEVNRARQKSGGILALESPVGADLVTGVPDSGVPSAIGFSNQSQIPYGVTLIKNKYIGRTFIKPSQELREKSVSVKLNVLKSNVLNQRVVLIDDSVIRGTTAKRLVQLLRRAGAKEVHLRIASPQVMYPCFFGIDTPRRKELIGINDLKGMKGILEADSIEFLSLEGLIESLDHKSDFCFGCFNGIYPVSTIKQKNE